MILPPTLKPLFGKLLLRLCDGFPPAKAFLRGYGLRTSKEWFGDRVVHVQLAGGMSFKLASFSRNYLSFELFWRGASYYEPISTLLLLELVKGGSRAFIDVGANIGFYSLVLATCQPKLKLVAF